MKIVATILALSSMGYEDAQRQKQKITWSKLKTTIYFLYKL